MPASVKIKFRDGTIKQYPDPKQAIVNGRGYKVVVEHGVLRLMDPYDVWTSWPLDIIESIEEQPFVRF